jgi:quercetin dioxygenase-like cupin family protein
MKSTAALALSLSLAGGTIVVHTHHAQALVYVLEGSIIMQVKGGAPVTLTPGQTFYEGPDDVHLYACYMTGSINPC